MEEFQKSIIFITGAPRSGTSMLTKVIDSHPDIAVLMENIFHNRRRHWERADFWNSTESLKTEVGKVYSKLKEPYVGNKVITPDVWDTDDIVRFCRLFKNVWVIFMVRNPIEVALSRLRREPADFFKVFNEKARDNILLDFRSRFHAYVSSWRQSVENYWKLRDGLQDHIKLIYYEDFCRDFENQAKEIFAFLGIPFSECILNWYERPHYNDKGELLHDLKYPDKKVFVKERADAVPTELTEVMTTIEWQYELWKNRQL